MPTFNPLCGGSIYFKKNTISPIIKNKLIDTENANIFLLDGTLLKKSNFLKTIF